MIKLSTNKAVFSDDWNYPGRCIRLTDNQNIPMRLRSHLMLLLLSPADQSTEGFAGYILVGHDRPFLSNTITVSDEFSYLANDDVVFADPSEKFFRAFFRAKSQSNYFLITERCNHYCVMCSQPPRDIDDSYLVSVILEAIPLLPRYTRSLGITGGEPTLLGEGLLQIIEACKRHLPETAIHVLSNGTTFQDNSFAAKVGAIGHPDLMFGIPIYSDAPEIHNFVVQAPNAWNATINGILNLKGNGVKVEVRVVLHKYTIPTLVNLANFITKNLLFVDQVALMGLEATGFAKSNWDDLWIHPKDYQKELLQSALICSRSGIRLLIYNLPLCWLHPQLHGFSVKSISDWKNDYPQACNNCAAFSACGGFFASNLAKGATEQLSPFTAETLTLSSQS